jgi:hypothetical protein
MMTDAPPVKRENGRVDCPKLRDRRQQLRKKMGGAFNNILSILEKDSKVKKVRHKMLTP